MCATTAGSASSPTEWRYRYATTSAASCSCGAPISRTASAPGRTPRYVLDEFFEGVPDDERYQILVKNACEFFGLDPEHELTPTP